MLRRSKSLIRESGPWVKSRSRAAFSVSRPFPLSSRSYLPGEKARQGAALASYLGAKTPKRAHLRVFALASRIAAAALLHRNMGLSPNMEADMTPGQRVRVRPASQLARRKDAAAGDTGTILCCYKVRGHSGERVDVQFSPKAILWGVAAEEFEPVESSGLSIVS